MRAKSGNINSAAFQEILERSKLHELDSRPMTCKEMELDGRVVNTLKQKGVIKAKDRLTTTNRIYIIWGPGEKYRYYMKKWGWA
jgi:hypothetical protein